jgi:hypothetical protein
MLKIKKIDMIHDFSSNNIERIIVDYIYIKKTTFTEQAEKTSYSSLVQCFANWVSGVPRDENA